MSGPQRLVPNVTDDPHDREGVMSDEAGSDGVLAWPEPIGHGLATALAVLTAVQDGLLALDTPIVAYLPQFTVNSRYEEHPERRMTLRHLLAHRAGFTHEAPLGNNMELEPQPHSFAQHVASISDSWLRYPVGYQQAYSNLGIDLAGYILQERAGERFEDYIKERVLDPLGMTGSTFDMEVIRSTGDRALGHVAGVDEIPGGIPVEIPMMPAGGLYTNTRDMARYIRYHLNGGELNGRQLLGDELLQEMYSVQFPEKGQRTGYGFGFVREMIASTYNIYHGGAGYGLARTGVGDTGHGAARGFRAGAFHRPPLPRARYRVSP
jgi:CubicO group peptidase (beta-lactamase class C family)